MDTVRIRPALQWHGHRRRRRHLLWMSVTASMAALIIAIGVLIAQANHNFSDVPTGTYYHDAVEWIFNRAVTAGIGGGQYGTGQSVRREDMAVFMRKLGIALTPIGVGAGAESSAMTDIDTLPIVCATTSNYTPTFPQSAFIFARVSVKATAAMGTFADVGVFPSFSTDGGGTWNHTPDNPIPGEARAVAMGGHVQLWSAGAVDLTPGTGYRFSMMLHRMTDAVSGGGGTADVAGYRCSTAVLISNRNPTMGPLGPGQPGR